nr:MAG TPA: hypothetical protein [Caudoviricetes sp.]
MSVNMYTFAFHRCNHAGLFVQKRRNIYFHFNLYKP